MLKESIERISSLISTDDIFIITSEILLEPIRNELVELPPENVIAEPYKRNTAPCLALSAAFIMSKYADEYSPENISVAVLTADQSIKPNDAFVRTVDTALSYVEQNKFLCTIGIKPTRPETGYGYIEVEAQGSEQQILPVKAFHEKPDLEKAQSYLGSGNYLWNSGMFFWRLDAFIESMNKNLPEVGNLINTMAEKYKGKTNVVMGESLSSINEIYKGFPDVSIDYGLMEKADNVVVAKALFEWDDIGSWDSLQRVKTANKDNNIVQGKSVLVDSQNTIVVNATESKKVLFAGLGLDGMVVVVTDDAVLVCPKERVQEVKKCVEEIRDSKFNEWL
jgi:mannose-1-phosphate guanylyltransferase